MSDNVYAVFQHAHDDTQTDIKAVWISHDGNIRQKIRDEGKAALHPWSPMGIFACLRSGIYIYDVCGKDINYWLSRGARNVMLRHGTGIKKIGKAIDNPKNPHYRLHHGNLLQRLFYGFLLPWHTSAYDLVIASSVQHAAQARDFFVVEEENVAITGSPRNDLLFSAKNFDVSADPGARWIRECRKDQRQICLYMPTFRDDKKPAFPFEWKLLGDICDRHGISILVRLHPYDSSTKAVEDISLERHLRLHENAQDPFLLFKDIDCLITDYSSVAYDFMLLEKPIIFFCHDLTKYITNSRNMYFDYNQVTPGPKPKNLIELEAVLRDLSAGRLADIPMQRPYQDTLKLFHQYRDAGSTARVYEEITSRFCHSILWKC